MWASLKRLLESEAEQRPADETPVEETKEVAKPLIIGEPVISLAKSLLESDDWDVEVDTNQRYSVLVHFRHKVEDLKVTYYKYQPYHGLRGRLVEDNVFKCALDWLTPDEHVHMLEVYAAWRVLQTEKANRERLRQQAEQREKFMVLANK